VVAPGPDNPLGKFAMRLGWTSYLIHGTNRPYSIGMRVSHGCLRMYPEDIESLFKVVDTGTPVRVVNQPYKAGWSGDHLYLEAHSPLSDYKQTSSLTDAVSSVVTVTDQALANQTWEQVVDIAEQQQGLPVPIQSPGYDAGQTSHAAPDLNTPSDQSHQGWFIQLGAFKEEETTRRMYQQIAGMDMEVVKGTPGSSDLCHILVGPFTSRGKADDGRHALKKATGIKGIVYPSQRYSDYRPCR
jgi:L,D-transpeptidase ErfK/SrfK